MQDLPARRIAILGVTGSVGQQALEVIADSLGTDHPLAVAGVAAGSNWRDALQVQHSGRPAAFIADEQARAEAAASGWDGELVASVDELLDVVQPDLVLNAIVGFAGFSATIAALDRGIDVALANKESLVAGGAICMQKAWDNDAQIIPVDSEHSALQQCISNSTPDEIKSLVLTASGGPFFGMSVDQLASVTLEQALDHPTWDMGGKITIDSATLMNKGLELIEACVLFDLPPERVETVVHRHSIVHALSRHHDGSMLAHLGWPDMKTPISWALHFPYRMPATVRELDLTDMSALEFFEPDLDAFPALKLARAAAGMGTGATCSFNAANEVAVDAFMAGRIRFTDIAQVVETVLDGCTDAGEAADVASVIAVDAAARDAARAALPAAVR